MKKVASKTVAKKVVAAITQKTKPTKTNLKQGAMVEKAEKPNDLECVEITFKIPKFFLKEYGLKS